MRCVLVFSFDQAVEGVWRELGEQFVEKVISPEHIEHQWFWHCGQEIIQRYMMKAHISWRFVASSTSSSYRHIQTF